MNEFQKRFKSFDNIKLLKILEDADNYEAQAVEAAKLELSTREVTDEEVRLVKDAMVDQQVKFDLRQKRIKKIGDRANALSDEILDTVNPIQEESPTIGRKINWIAIGFGVLALYQLVLDFSLISYMFSSPYAEWDLSMIFHFVPLVILLFGIFFFWKRNKIGWILIIFFCSKLF